MDARSSGFSLSSGDYWTSELILAGLLHKAVSKWPFSEGLGFRDVWSLGFKGSGGVGGFGACAAVERGLAAMLENCKPLDHNSRAKVFLDPTTVAPPPFSFVISSLLLFKYGV